MRSLLFRWNEANVHWKIVLVDQIWHLTRARRNITGDGTSRTHGAFLAHLAQSCNTTLKPRPVDVQHALIKSQPRRRGGRGQYEKRTEGGQPKNDFRRRKLFMYKKDPKEPNFWSGQLEPAWRGAVAGGALFLRTLAVTGSNPAMRVRFEYFETDVSFCALGRKTQRRTQTGALCAIALAKVVSLGVGRASLFPPIFSDAYFAVYGARRALRSKTWVSAPLHRQGPRMAFEARNV